MAPLQSGLAGADLTRFMRTRAVSFLRRNHPAKAGAPAQKNGVMAIWRSIALWKKRLPGARSIAAGSPSADSPTARPYALSLGLSNGDVFSAIIAFSPGFIVRAQARGRQGPRGVEVPLIYIAHGLSDNVLAIASTSRIFVSSLRKNGYTVEFREFSGGHHLSRPVVDQSMSWLITAFHEHRSSPRKIDSGRS